MSEQKAFGHYLQELREKNGYKSQRSFALKIGVSNATVARIERGEVEPSFETMHKMAEVLGVDYLDLAEKQSIVSKTDEDSLYDKIKRLNKSQLVMVTNIVDEFLKLGGKA